MKYQVNARVRIINAITRLMAHYAVGPKQYHLLTVRGRKTGKLYKTPVAILDQGGQRWLVAPYGEVGWLRNARAAGQVVLSRGGHSQTWGLRPADAQSRATVLKSYLKLEPITRPFFDATPDAPLEAFEKEAKRHPVFQLIEANQL